VCSLVLLIVLSVSSVVYSQTCTCELVDPRPRFLPGQEVWVAGSGRPVYIRVYHYYGDYKVIITFYDWDYNIIRQDEFINPVMYMEGDFWVEQPPFTEVVRVDLVRLSEDSDVEILWDFCMLCCPSTTTITTTEIVESTITETHTETQFIHDSRAWIIILVFLIIVLLLKLR
jgi:hypothetical protein